MKITLHTDEFRRSHGRRPGGSGMWMLAPKGQESDHKAWRSVTGTLAEAKRKLAESTETATDWVVLP